MPSKLTLTLFGTPRVYLNDELITRFRSLKTQALLTYLAVTGRPHTRLALAGLLWGELSDKQARVNLSKSLSNLRQLVGEHLQIERQTVAFSRDENYQLDIDVFWQASAFVEETSPAEDLSLGSVSSNSILSDLDHAVDLCRGDFLDGFYVQDAPEFEQWVEAERLRLNQRLSKTLMALADAYASLSEIQKAIGYVQRILGLEPWREEMHQRLMLYLAQDGQRGAALAHFESCRQILADELGVEPDAATLELADRIRNGEIEIAAAAASSIESGVGHSAQPPGAVEKDAALTAEPNPVLSRHNLPRHNLPTPATPFVGRQIEIETLTDNLLDPGCRLLTLIGHGGVGKTRLAIQIARKIASQEPTPFAHGILHVPLESVSTPSGLVSAIAESAAFSFYEDVPFQEQLSDYLREKEILLLLDNFEHLLETAPLLLEMLTTAPDVKILVTSRETVNLQEAWFHPVVGLSYSDQPHSDADEGEDEAIINDAIALFVQCAERIGGTLAQAKKLKEAHSAVARICRLVNGTPLGIELAASWLRVMSAPEIAQELEESLDLLVARHQYVPERHRSIRAVLEQSWQLLDDREKHVLKQLAVFRGRAERLAIKAVAGASIPLLAGLVEKSLLTVESDGRYRLHEMLRQFLHEKLVLEPDEALDARRAHSAYYLAYMNSRAELLASGQQRSALGEIDRELDNIRHGWRTACLEGQFDSLSHSAHGLYRFYRIRSRYQEGKELFAETTVALQKKNGSIESNHGTQLQSQLYIYEGAFDFLLGEYGQAELALTRGLELSKSTNQLQQEGRALNFLGQIAGQRGEIEEARRLLQEGLSRYRDIDDFNGMAAVLHKMAQIDGSVGDYESQKERALESLDFSRQSGRPSWIASALDVLGWATLCLGEYDESEDAYRESLALSQEIGSQLGRALALGGIGSVAWVAGGSRLEEAHDYLGQSLALCREIGHRHHISDRLWYLGQIASDMGRYEQAQRYAEEGLSIAQAIGNPIFSAYNLSCLGEVAVALGNLAEAHHYLLKSLRLSLNAQHLPPLSMALILFARLRMEEIEAEEIEAEQIDAHEKGKIVGEVLNWLSLIAEHSGCWLVFRQRADELSQLIVGSLAQDVYSALVRSPSGGTLEEVVEGIVGK